MCRRSAMMSSVVRPGSVHPAGPVRQWRVRVSLRRKLADGHAGDRVSRFAFCEVGALWRDAGGAVLTRLSGTTGRDGEWDTWRYLPTRPDSVRVTARGPEGQSCTMRLSVRA